jgi:hypothetical protein
MATALHFYRAVPRCWRADLRHAIDRRARADILACIINKTEDSP